MQIKSNLQYRNCIQWKYIYMVQIYVYIQTSINEKYTANQNTKYNSRL